MNQRQSMKKFCTSNSKKRPRESSKSIIDSALLKALLELTDVEPNRLRIAE